jgi:DNA-binding beta-propeller fold protein YncE
VYVAGSSLATPTDYKTVAYNAATGARLWAARYRDGTAAAVAVSPDGTTVYVTGSWQGATSADYATVAYNARTGAQLWAARYDGPAGGNDYASAVSVSPGGSRVYVTGSSDGATSTDYATVAYSAATGARLWAARYNGAGKYGYDSPNAMAVSPGGSRVYVTGRSQGAKTSDYATVAYRAATGARLWAARYHRTASSFDIAYAVAAGPGGNSVYVTGSSQEGESSDYATVAYNAATGARLWLARYRDGAATAMRVSPDGSRVYVTGSSQGRHDPGEDATVAYRAATGTRQWVARYHSPNTDDGANSLAVSPSGTRLYVTGSSLGPKSAGYATVAYRAATGARLWAARYDGPGNSHDFAYAVVLGPAGTRVYVTGSSYAGKSSDYLTVAYRG